LQELVISLARGMAIAVIFSGFEQVDEVLAAPMVLP
jgi:hypothetical protein